MAANFEAVQMQLHTNIAEYKANIALESGRAARRARNLQAIGQSVELVGSLIGGE